MALLNLQDIHLSYGLPPLLDGVEFSLERGERVALVGRNGEGKSTLLKIIAGEIQPDDGEIWLQQGIRIARLEQEVPRKIEGNVYDVVAAGLGELGEIIARYHHVTQALDAPGAMDEMSRLQQKIEAADGWSVEQRIATTLIYLFLNPY